MAKYDKPRNPTGRGGFGDHPENINRCGRWTPTMSRSYLLNKFQRMTLSQIDEYITERGEDLTVVERSCIDAVVRTIDNDPTTALAWGKEVADRTEGKPRQQIDAAVSTEPPSINIAFK